MRGRDLLLYRVLSVTRRMVDSLILVLMAHVAVTDARGCTLNSMALSEYACHCLFLHEYDVTNFSLDSDHALPTSTHLTKW